MSYGAARQLLTAGLMDATALMEATKSWPDNIKRLHAAVGCEAFTFTQLNSDYIKAQQGAMDLAAGVSEQRIRLHNAVVSWMNALDAEAKRTESSPAADAVDPHVADTGTLTTRA